MNAASAASGAAASAPNDYFERVLPEPYRILGLQLLPLSLGRYRLLHRFESPFVAEGPAKASLNDLLLAVLICSMRCDEFLEFIQSKNFRRDVAHWARRILPHAWIGLIPWIGRYWRSRHGFNYLEKIELFQRYVVAAQRIPRFTHWHESPRPNSAHWSHAIEVCLRGELNWSDEEIQEAPLSKALADYFAFAESQGTLSILSDDDLEQAEHNAQRIEAAMKGWRN